MKKLARLLSLVLVLLLAVCVFVACNDTPAGGETPGGETPGDETPGEDAGSKKQTFTVTIQFLDPKTGEKLGEDITRTEVAYGTDGSKLIPVGYLNNVTKYADYVIEGWDTDGDNLPDENYKEVKNDLVIKAVFREKITLIVNFYDTPTTFKGVAVKEGDPIDVSQVTPNSQIGQVFRQWVNADATDPTTLSCAKTNANFVAEYAKLDSVIPMINKGSIRIDGKKEEIYKSAAYLPINEEKHVDYESGTYSTSRPQYKDGVIPDTDAKGAVSSWITADAWLLWDGDYIYMMVEVSDKTLSYRNPLYVSQNYNPWLNDSVEAYFNFEQNYLAEKNSKKLSIDALNQKLYANSIAKLGQNSTHFADMDGAARSALGYFKNGALQAYDTTDGLTADKTALEATDDVGVQYAGNTQAKNYSYRVELKFVAKTEGVPDKENYEVDDNGRLPTGYELENGVKVPAIDITKSEQTNDPTLTDFNFYRFTHGEALEAGNFVRFSLQINDMMVGREAMENKESGFYEGDEKNAEQQKSSSFFKPDGKTFTPPFVPTGHIQYLLSHYVTFSLGDKNSQAKWEVYELKGTEMKNDNNPKKMIDANGNEIVQGSEIFTVEIAK